MVKKGDSIDLDLPVKAVVDGEKWEGKLSELVARPTIISVYMRNNTDSCDTQARQLQEVADELDRLGVGLIGLSKDTPGSHLKYAGKLGLSFPLVSDPEHSFSEACDALVEKKMYGRTFMGPTRSAYYLSPQGQVLGVVEAVVPQRHGEQLLSLAAD